MELLACYDKCSTCATKHIRTHWDCNRVFRYFREQVEYCNKSAIPSLAENVHSMKPDVTNVILKKAHKEVSCALPGLCFANRPYEKPNLPLLQRISGCAQTSTCTALIRAQKRFSLQTSWSVWCFPDIAPLADTKTFDMNL